MEDVMNGAAERPMSTLEHAEHVMRAAQGGRAEALESARSRADGLEKSLAALDAERTQANTAWQMAEDNMRAELGGYRHFIEVAEQPDLALKQSSQLESPPRGACY
jgi:hypothetical protein